ncbi:hypothetical protein CK218_28180 [Mesorhizobium sp. WSM3879]|uniref:hypothetical protein n=1 Tax=Mesorhizobium sp. WSM3879 TaxID=2029406 RepID=UPI000BAEA734|nr:hypothetical protein [Mesorhizobium sp. WSM3879]PBB77811.1 hypothetical protein CK218_28180 [Mesorhizobium sp. WSM3879]
MSDHITILVASKYISLLDHAARNCGLLFRMGENFEEYAEITASIAGKARTDPNFRPDCSQLVGGRAFWIVGEDRSGKVAHVQALRVDDLTTTNLARHLESLKAFYANPKSLAGSGSSCICRAPTAQKITRLVAYHGDIWLRQDFRGQGLSRTFAGIAFGLAWVKWSPDFIYALVPTWSVEKGVADQYGYLHREANGAILSLPDRGIEEDDWLVWLTRRELSRLIKVTVAKALEPSAVEHTRSRHS